MRSIKMRANVGGGLAYGTLAIGSTYSVDDQLAAELVNRQAATYTDFPAGSTISPALMVSDSQSNVLGLQSPIGVLVPLGASAGKVSRAADVVAGRSFTAADFGVGVVPLNNAAAQAFTLNIAATMGLAGAGNVLPVQILGALHTFVQGAGVTINDLTGTRQLNGKYVFVQRGTSEVWDFE